MLKNYIMTTWRNTVKSKGYSIINIVGLTIGVACCLMILLFVRDELSYDRYNEKADRTYRIGLRAVLNNNAMNGCVSCSPLAEALMREFHDVEVAARARNFGFPVFRYQDKVFSEEKVFWADSTFFDVFTVRFLAGDPKAALNKPNTIVLTRSMAEKYFGDEEPLGQSINADNRRDYIVTGVIEDVPRNSHFHYDFLASLSTYEDSRNPNWVSNNYYTYLVLDEGTSVPDFEARLLESVKDHVDPQIRAALGFGVDEFIANGGEYTYFLQPMLDIHLKSHLEFEVETNGSWTNVLLFSAIAVGVLIVACINFINLATARSAKRAKEVGIRKTVGSTKRQLVAQFLIETVFMSGISVLFSLVLIAGFLPIFNRLAGKSIQFSILDPLVIPFLVLLVLFVGITAGLYPAFYLASFHPTKVLKGEMQGKRRALLRNILVIFQFSLSIILILCTLVIGNQMNYIRTKDLGFNKEDVVIVYKTDDLSDRLQPFRESLLQNPRILAASNTNRLFGPNFGNSVFMIAGASGLESRLLWQLATDEQFLDAYQIQIKSGRYFEKGRESDLNAVVINETAASELPFDDPVGKQLQNPGDDGQKLTIIGVVKDFHFESLDQKIRPLLIGYFGGRGFGSFVSVRIRPEEQRSTLQFIEEKWKQFALNQAFEYDYFEDHFSKEFLTEERTGNIFMAFAILAIMIASLGLFGLSAFGAEQRTKEVGLRKVMGATEVQITGMLILQFIKWVMIANVIAWPTGWFIMSRWMRNYAYQGGIQIWMFLMSAVIALSIAVLTVSYQSIKAALANPAKSLRYE